jgi:excisionase family DNA binding protein
MAKGIIIPTYEESELRNLFFECISEALQAELAKLSIPKETQKQILTRQETAKLLSISLPTLHDYTRRDVIQAHRLGNKVRYRIEDIHKALVNIKERRGSNGR